MDRIEPLFDKHRFVVRCISFLALLVSFGVVFPPLAAVIVCAICYYSLCEQWNIGRLLFEAEERGYSWYLHKLADDLTGTVEFFVPALLPMMMIASLLFSAILFDTFGDQGGLHVGLLYAVLMWLFPLLIWGIGSIDWKQVYRSYCKRKQDDSSNMMPLVEIRQSDNSNPLLVQNQCVHIKD
jgi:hypothetical protein